MLMLPGALGDIWRRFVFMGWLAKELPLVFSSFPDIHMQTSPDLISCHFKCTVLSFHAEGNKQNNKFLFRGNSEGSSAVSRWLLPNKPFIHCCSVQLSCFYLSQCYRPLIKQMYKEAQLLNCPACSVGWDSQMQQKEFYSAQDEYISLPLFPTKGSRYKWPHYLCQGEVESNLFLLNRMVLFFILLAWPLRSLCQSWSLIWTALDHSCYATEEFSLFSLFFPSPLLLLLAQVIVRKQVKAPGYWIQNTILPFSEPYKE